jgi:hypothetical protein
MTHRILKEEWNVRVDVGFATTGKEPYFNQLTNYLEQYAAKQGVTVEAALRIIASGDFDLVMGTTLQTLVQVDVNWTQFTGSKTFIINIHKAHSPFVDEIIKFFKIVPKGLFEEDVIGQSELDWGERGEGNVLAHKALFETSKPVFDRELALTPEDFDFTLENFEIIWHAADDWYLQFCCSLAVDDRDSDDAGNILQVLKDNLGHAIDVNEITYAEGHLINAGMDNTVVTYDEVKKLGFKVVCDA